MDALIERLGEQNKFVRWYRQYACKANGMPIEPEGSPTLHVEHTHTHEGQPPATTPAQPQPAQSSTLPPWVKTAVVAGLSALGGGSVIGGAGVVFDWWESRQAPAPEQSPATGSLLQDLEDRGFHLPSDE